MVLNRFANAFNVLISSLKFIGKDKSLMAIPLIMLFSNIIVIGIFSFFFLFGGLVFSQGMIILLGILFILFLYFLNTLLASAQSWMVYEVAKGKDTTVSSGLKRAFANTKDILFFSITSLIVGLIISAIRGKNSQGVASVVRNTAADALNFVTGIAKRLTIPAMIITEMSFGQAVKNLKKSIKATPEILIYEIGIRPIIGMFTFITIAICALIVWSGYLITGIVIFGSYILFISLLSTLINQIYYTLVYLVLIEKKNIPGIKIR